MKGNMRIFCVLMAIISLQLAGENLIDVVDEAELFIERTYKGEMARQLAKTKLQNIVLDKEKTDRQKIEAIQKEFLQPKKDDEEITEANAYRLIWTPQLSWDIHSIAISYDMEKSDTRVISGETVEAKKSTHMKSNENGGKSALSEAGSTGMATGLGYQTKISLTGLLTARPQFKVEADGSHKTDWDESKTELWSKSRQEQLASSFEELTKDIRSTKVFNCHLTFAIDFRNGCDEDLMFSASSTVPVYMGGTLVLEARPENIGNNTTFTIPSRATATIKFRGEISTTQAYSLLEFMKTSAPTILPEQGQLAIFSANGKIKNAITESRAVSHSVIRCGEYEWKVRSTWHNRRVKVREALWAVNSLYEKGPFDIENDACVTMFGKFRCGPYPGMAEADAYPIVEMNGRFFSRLEKSQLDSRLPDTGIRFHLDKINAYIESERYVPQFYSVLLDDLLTVVDKDRNGSVQYLLGWMYDGGRGTSRNEAKSVEWFRKAADQGSAKAQHLLACYYDSGLGGCEKDISMAVNLQRRAAEHGYANAQYFLGRYYYDGMGVQKDTSKAVEWYRKAAEQGYAPAQCDLADCYINGIGVQKDMTKALDWWRKAAEQGNAKAQFNLGYCYGNGIGVARDMGKAIEWYRKAAEQKATIPYGDEAKSIAWAQNNLGAIYYNGDGVVKNLSKAVEWYQKAAEQGNAYAQNQLGTCYENGKGVEKNMSKAIMLYHKAAEQGNASAQFNLGRCYEFGDGVKNMTKAVEWYRKAAEQGNVRAQYNLGWCYENGEGVEKNMTKAVEWYRKSAEQGNADAQFFLAICYGRGEGVQKDMSKAAEWFQKAADQGNAFAQNRLAQCYESGSGVEKNISKAMEWYRKAAAQGNKDAIKRLQELNQ